MTPHTPLNTSPRQTWFTACWIPAVENDSRRRLSFASEVEVITDPATIRTAESWSLDDLDIAEAVSGPLAALSHKREQQRHDRAFGALLGKERVYLRLPDPEEPAAWWLTEHDSAGRRVRQIELRPDGTAAASSAADWPMKPPFDLGDPQLAAHEISQEEFERAWERAAQNEKQGPLPMS